MLELSDNTISIMADMCQNLRRLAIIVSKELIKPIACMVANIPNLQALVLSAWDPPLLDSLFNELAKHQLLHLQDLALSSMDNCHVDSLENFLSRSRPPLRSLVIARTCLMTEAHINVILHYLRDTLESLVIYYDVDGVSKECIERVSAYKKNNFCLETNFV